MSTKRLRTTTCASIEKVVERESEEECRSKCQVFPASIWSKIASSEANMETEEAMDTQDCHFFDISWEDVVFSRIFPFLDLEDLFRCVEY